MMYPDQHKSSFGRVHNITAIFNTIFDRVINAELPISSLDHYRVSFSEQRVSLSISI